MHFMILTDNNEIVGLDRYFDRIQSCPGYKQILFEMIGKAAALTCEIEHRIYEVD